MFIPCFICWHQEILNHLGCLVDLRDTTQPLMDSQYMRLAVLAKSHISGSALTQHRKAALPHGRTCEISG